MAGLLTPDAYSIFDSYLHNDTGTHGRMDCTYLLIDYSSAGTDAEIQAMPTAKVFKLSAYEWDNRDALGFIRSAWSTESEGLSGKHSYLAFKACVILRLVRFFPRSSMVLCALIPFRCPCCENNAPHCGCCRIHEIHRANGLPNHNDLDGATFVFEAGGQRWAIDMASDNYSLKNYFSQNLR